MIARSLARARAWITSRGRLDILINNAGILLPPGGCRPSTSSMDDLRAVFETNVFGVVAVTNAMLPMLLRAERGRIVNISSEMGSMTRALNPAIGFGRPPDELLRAYTASKAAVNSITVQYATELQHTAIKVNAVCPGYSATALTGGRGRPASVGAATAMRMALLQPDGPNGSFMNEYGAIEW